MKNIDMLIDNDIVIKLAQWNVYAEALAALNISNQCVGSLGVMLRYMGRYSAEKRAALTKNPQEADRLYAVLCSIQEVEPTAEEEALAYELTRVAIENGLDLDVGEISIISLAAFRINTLVATGDKRAIRELPQLEQIKPTIATIRGRILCLEQIVAKICKKNGMRKLRDAVLLARHADTTVTMVYDHYHAHGQSMFLGALSKVVQEHINGPAPGWLTTT